MNPEASPEDVLGYIDEEMQNRFPAKFGKPSPSPVAEPNRTTRPSSNRSDEVSAKDLSQFQMEVGKTFVEEGVVNSLDDYAKQLAEVGDL
jgi:hypothetical protein